MCLMQFGKFMEVALLSLEFFVYLFMDTVNQFIFVSNFSRFA